MFESSARYYDRIYSKKDYAAEAAKVEEIAFRHRGISGGRLLDVACGTGGHIAHLKRHFTVEGMDVDPNMLDVARPAHPDVEFHLGDMRDFDLGRTFDVVTCLFSSIGYVKTLEGLRRATGCLAKHVAPGGLLIVEPWFTPESWNPGLIHALLVEDTDLRIARMNVSMVEGTLSYFDFHYLIGTPGGVDHRVEHHELGLFTVNEVQSAFQEAGMSPSYDAVGLDGRGLHIGVRSA